MQYVWTEKVIAAIGDEMSLNDSAANDVFEHMFVREERSRPNMKAKRSSRFRSSRLPGQSARMRAKLN